MELNEGQIYYPRLTKLDKIRQGLVSLGMTDIQANSLIAYITEKELRERAHRLIPYGKTLTGLGVRFYP